MLRPECHGCKHLRKNQCELDEGVPINMEIGSMDEYVTEPDKDRSCGHFELTADEAPTQL